MFLKDERIDTLPKIMQTPHLGRNIIFISKMNDASIHVIFENETCNFVQEMVLRIGVWIGTLYKFLGRTINDNSIIVIKGSNEEENTPTILGEKMMLGH